MCDMTTYVAIPEDLTLPADLLPDDFDDEAAIDTTLWNGGIRTAPGATHTEAVACEGAGKIAGWIDWNNNGVFDDTVIGVCWVAVVIGDSVEDIAEIIAEEYDEISNEQAKNIAEYLITARRAQQEQFGDVATNLDAAFAELEQHGIIARAYCGWTVGEGQAEILDEAADIPRANGEPWIGHVFITGQQIEAYIEFEGDAALDMAYGAILTDEEDALPDREADELYETKTLAMMTDIVLPTLAKHGVETQWSGSIADLVTLTNAVYYQPI